MDLLYMYKYILINACSLEISLIGWIHVNIAEQEFKTSFRSTVLI